jgi:signal transduction histidine kinase
MSRTPESERTGELTLRARRRWVLRAGFAALLILLGVSAILAYHIQRGSSDEAARIYHTYIQQEESLFNIRRSLWLASVSVRDLLLDVSPDRETRFAASIEERRKDVADSLARLARHPIPGQNLPRLTAQLNEFWTAVAAVPAAARHMNQAERYNLIQNEVTARRLSLSELVRELSALGRNSLASAERRLAENRRTSGWDLLTLISLALVAGVVFSVLSLRRVSTLEAKTLAQYDEVSRTKAELQALSAQLMSIQETERARLSRELHDEIGQALATLRLELARLESSVRDDLPDIHGRLGRSRQIVDSTVKAVRNISLMLRPSLLDDLGLVAALQWLAEDSSRRTGVPCVVRGEEQVSDDLPIEIRTCVYRVVQEAVHNAEKHAAAHNVEIALVQHGGELEIQVDDDGMGLAGGDQDRWKTGAHLGILGMRERVAGLAGQFEIGPRPGGGTRVKVSLPVPVAEPIQV